MWKKISQFSQIFSQSDLKKRWVFFQNCFWMIKLTKTPILATFQVFFFKNCKFYYSRIEVFQNCSTIFLSVSLVRKNMRELRDFFHKIWIPRHHDREHQVNHQRRSSEREMNGGTGAKRAISVHALDQSAEIDGKFNKLHLAPQRWFLQLQIHCMFYKNWGKPLRCVYRRLHTTILILYPMKKKLIQNSKIWVWFLKYFQTVIQVLSKSDRYQFENFC